MKVYLAGKISRGDWRTRYVKGLDDIGDSPQGDIWPVFQNAIADGIHYVGPYFRNMDFGGHGLCHGRSSHGNGIGANQEFPCKEILTDERFPVANKCIKAIQYSDVVIVRPEQGCYGTMFEAGFAVALRRRIYMCYDNVDYGEFSEKNDFWLSSCFCITAACVDDVLDILISEVELQNRINLLHLCESPVEKSFFTEACNRGLDIKPQVKINEYRVDFANEKLKVVIEIDGHQFHSSKEQIRRDLQRQRSLEMCGWRVHRFSGSEVYANVGNCVEQCITLMDVRRKELQSV